MSARFLNVSRRLRGLLPVVAAWLLSAAIGQAGQATVFAAASLKPALDPLAEQFEATTGHDLTIAYAGTSVLARQIAQGAPADVFISASTDWMDWLASEGQIVQATRFDLAGNRLVLISADAGQRDIVKALGTDTRIAMAFVDAVPAGIYGKATLEALDLWQEVSARVVQTDNVRLALALVARGEVPLGIVYASDAHSIDAVSVLGTFDEALHPPILYPVAQVEGSTATAANAFLTFLQTPETLATLTAAGFRPVER